MNILCVGMAVCDVLLSPVPEDIMQLDSAIIAKPVMACGGDALNVALACSKLGAQVALAGRVAADLPGSFIRSRCQDAGILLDNLINDPLCATATTYALLDPSGERHFLTENAIFAEVTDNDVSDTLIKWADIVYFGSAMALDKMNTGGLERLFRRAKSLGKRTVMDAAINPHIRAKNWMETLSGALCYTDIFFPSLSEASEITGETEPRAIAQYFRPFDLAVFGVKLGHQGSYVTDFHKEHFLPPLQGVKVVDTTGAGDSFMAGLLYGLGLGWSAADAATLATIVAGKNIEAIGGTAGVPTFEEVFPLYQSRNKDKKGEI